MIWPVACRARDPFVSRREVRPGRNGASDVATLRWLIRTRRAGNLRRVSRYKFAYALLRRFTRIRRWLS